MAVIRNNPRFQPYATTETTINYRIRLLPQNEIIYYGQGYCRQQPGELTMYLGKPVYRAYIYYSDIVAPYFEYIDTTNLIFYNDTISSSFSNTFQIILFEYSFGNSYTYTSTSIVYLYNFNGINGIVQDLYGNGKLEYNCYETFFEKHFGYKPFTYINYWNTPVSFATAHTRFELFWRNFRSNDRKINLAKFYDNDYDNFNIPITLTNNANTVTKNRECKVEICVGIGKTEFNYYTFDASENFDLDTNLSHTQVLTINPYSICNAISNFIDELEEICGVAIRFYETTENKVYAQVCLPFIYDDSDTSNKGLCDVSSNLVWWCNEYQQVDFLELNGTTQWSTTFSNKYILDFTNKKYNTEAQEYITLNTGWITEDENNRLQGIYKAPSVNLVLNYKTFNVETTETQWEEYKYVNDKKLLNKTLKFKLKQKLNYTYG